MPGFSIEAHKEWFETTSEQNKCMGCKEIIIGKMMQYVLFIENEPIYTWLIYCMDCYVEKDKEET